MNTGATVADVKCAGANRMELMLDLVWLRSMVQARGAQYRTLSLRSIFLKDSAGSPRRLPLNRTPSA